MQRTKFTSVEQFIKAAPEQAQSILKKLRAAVRKALPKADETISYNIPCYKLNGKYVVYFAGYPNHVSIYPVPKTITGMKEDIAKYKAGKGTLKFANDKPLPLGFIKKVILQLAKENAARNKTTK